MFPWQSGSDGEEETQALNLNPRSQRWVPDNSYLQRHVGSAIALNVWQYFQVTHDVEFLDSYGAEIILEIARFWSSMTSAGAMRSVVWWVPTSFMTAIRIQQRLALTTTPIPTSWPCGCFVGRWR